jgi:hypothetical protein
MATSSRLTRSRWAAIGAAIAVTLGGGGLIGVSASGKGATDPTLSSGFTAVSPVRILDTRSGTKPSGNTTFVQVTGSITLPSGATSTVVPAGASTVSMNLTVTEGVRNQGYGFVTAYPCSSAAAPAPNASSINFVEGTDVANGLSVPLGDTGGLCLNVYGSAHLIIDVNGYFDQIDSYALNRRTLPTGRVTIDDPANEVGLVNAVVYRDDGTPFIAYGREDDHALMGASCADPACTDITFTGRLFPTDGRVITMDMALGADGNPIIVYESEDSDGVQVVACSDPLCAFALTNEITTPGSGRHPSIAISTDGRPLVASGGNGVWVTVCEDDLCIDATTEEVLVAANTGEPDITIGVLGQPVIAFVSGGNLWSASCTLTAPLCSTQTGPTNLLGLGTVTSPSIVITPTGQPDIVVVDTNANEVLVSKCVDVLCENINGPRTVIDGLTDPFNTPTNAFIGPDGSTTVAINNDGLITLGACDKFLCAQNSFAEIEDAGDPSSGSNVSVGIGLDGVPLLVYHDGDDDSLVAQRAFWMDVG